MTMAAIKQKQKGIDDMNDHSHCNQEKPLIGILMLETTFPRIPGDIGNPETFHFPVIYKTVRGASPEKVVIDADAGLIQDFIDAGHLLVAQGVKAIATSCGFLALFHRQLVEALPVPVFTSSLLQVHLAGAVIHRDQKIGIITARKQSLTAAHFIGVGIENYPLVVVGMEDTQEFNAVFFGGKQLLDEKKCRLEMQRAALHLMNAYPEVGAIVLECTNMPPYSDSVRLTTDLPVFDAVTMVNHAYSLISTGC